jgi:hypothetical protein
MENVGFCKQSEQVTENKKMESKLSLGRIWAYSKKAHQLTTKIFQSEVVQKMTILATIKNLWD